MIINMLIDANVNCCRFLNKYKRESCKKCYFIVKNCYDPGN